MPTVLDISGADTPTLNAPVRTVEVQAGTALAVFPDGSTKQAAEPDSIDVAGTADVMLRAVTPCRVRVIFADDPVEAARPTGPSPSKRRASSAKPKPKAKASRRPKTGRGPYESRNLTELRALAAKFGLTGVSKLDKAELIAELRKAAS